MQFVRGSRLFCFKRSAVPATKWFAGVRRVGSFAAPLPPETPKRKKVSKDERRAMVESFINRYRSMNAGKFPPASVTQKEVGGSYYVVRELVQELENNSKVNSSNSSLNLSFSEVEAVLVAAEGQNESCIEAKDDVKMLDSAVHEDKSFSEFEAVSTAAEGQNNTCTEVKDYVKILDFDDKQVEANQVSQVCTSARQALSGGGLKAQIPVTVGSHCGFVLEQTNVLKDDAKCLEKLEDDKEENASVDGSDKILKVSDKQKIVQVSDQHIASAEECKIECQTVVLEETNVLNDDAKCLGKLEDGKIEDASVDSSDKLLKVPDSQKFVQVSNQHIASAEEYKNECQTVVLEETNMLKDDGNCLGKLEDDKVEDASMDSSDKILKVPDNQKIVQVSDQHNASAEECKTERQTVVLDKTNVLKDDAKCLGKLEDDKVEDASVDSSDKFLKVPDNQKIVQVSDQHIASAEGCKTDCRTVQSNFGKVEGGILKEEIEVGKEEGVKKEQTASEDLQDSSSPEHKAEHHQQSVEEEKHARNFSSEQRNDSEHSMKSTLWGSLKSFADGIITIWRKS